MSIDLYFHIFSKPNKEIQTNFVYFADVQVIAHNTPYSHRKEIRWTSVSEAASGKYICKASVIKDDSEETKTWNLEIVQPKLPEIVDSNFVNGKTLEHSLGEPLNLHCKFIGIPHPEVTWYKNNDEITNDRNDSRIWLNNDNTVLSIKYAKAEDQGKYKCLAENRIAKVALETTLKITSNKRNFTHFLVRNY